MQNRRGKLTVPGGDIFYTNNSRKYTEDANIKRDKCFKKKRGSQISTSYIIQSIT